MPRRSEPNDFWSHIDRTNPDGCWPWLGALDEHGYGRVRYHGTLWKAHRLAWTLTNGEIPDGLLACHRCDNPPCCNPKHLFLGTYADNMRDSAEKGRHPRNATGYLPSGDQHHSRLHPEVVARGERNGSAILNEDQVREIRRRHDAGESLRKLARNFDVAKGTIVFITTGKTWRHIL